MSPLQALSTEARRPDRGRGALRRTLLLALLLLLAWSGSGLAVPQLVRVRAGAVGTEATRVDSLWLDGRLEEAHRLLQANVDTAEEISAPRLTNLGMLERLLGRGDGIALFRRAARVEERFHYPHWQLGVALTDSGLLEQGEEALRKAVKLDDEYYEARVDLAANLRRQGRLEEAEQMLQPALALQRTNPRAYLQLARVQVARNQFERAEDVLRDGIARFPYEQLLGELITLLTARGRAEEAAVPAARYLELYPKGPRWFDAARAVRTADPSASLPAPDLYRHTTFSSERPVKDPAELLPLEDRLQYKVHWGFLGLGNLTIEVAETEWEGRPAWRARYIVHSNPAIPFVAIHDTFDAVIDRELRFTHRLDMAYHEKDYEGLKVYDSDYETGWFTARNWYGHGYWYTVRHPLPPNLYDSTSQLWMAQQLVLGRTPGTAFVELSGGFEQTSINMVGPDGEVEVEGREWELYKIDGIMPYSGIAGLTGDFQGWYTAGLASIPARAKFRIFLGWITISWEDRVPTSLAAGTPMPLVLPR
jgi:tetratricopeptide (TPR) repeat protein